LVETPEVQTVFRLFYHLAEILWLLWHTRKCFYHTKALH